VTTYECYHCKTRQVGFKRTPTECIECHSAYLLVVDVVKR
jgi:hypothetical protein